MLQIDDLQVSVEDRPILKGLSLKVNAGEVHAIMGPNGSGKSTLAYAIAGHPDYEITDGEILLDGENIEEMDPEAVGRHIVTENRVADLQVVMSNSYGFGGTNACLIFKKISAER